MTIRYLRSGNIGLYRPGNYRASANGCFRNIVTREYHGQPLADETQSFTFAVGTLCETLVADRWKKQGKNAQLDVEVTEPITDTVHLMGHIDAILDGVIIEEKSIQSQSSFKKIYKGGIYKVENVAQLVQYMLMKEQTEGILLYTLMGWYGDKTTIGQQRAFKVNIDDVTGRVLVEGREETSFDVMDILYHRQQAAECIANKTIYPEAPTTLDPPWTPCGGCWLQPMCEKWEQNKDDTEFWNNVEKHLDTVGRR